MFTKWWPNDTKIQNLDTEGLDILVSTNFQHDIDR